MGGNRLTNLESLERLLVGDMSTLFVSVVGKSGFDLLDVVEKRILYWELKLMDCNGERN